MTVISAPTQEDEEAEIFLKRGPILKIDTSQINLSSQWAYSEQQHVRREIRVSFLGLLSQGISQLSPINSFDPLSPGSADDTAGAAEELPDASNAALTEAGTKVELSSQFSTELEKLREILSAIIERMNATAMKDCCIKLSSVDRVHLNSFPGRAIRVEYDIMEKTTYTYEETETTDFFADGVVKTTDGEIIDFSFQMNLAREFFREDRFVHQEKGHVLIDPLIINLDSTSPRLAEAQISIDLDMDGEDEEIPALMPGSGFLSLDRNKDGIINDGSELFGPVTGDGFAELAEYDLDENFWIDENDDIFDELTLWESDEKGDMQLTRIKDAGIGAIYLVAAPTPFDMKDDDNHLEARIKKTGVALNEDGSVSSIQEMDWTV